VLRFTDRADRSQERAGPVISNDPHSVGDSLQNDPADYAQTGVKFETDRSTA
jgi:hypothetical protein